MADYYPLIARAVAGLDKNTGDARRALYVRARAALVGQLRGVTPALSESDVTRERLALEESIRKVEAESARHTFVEPPRSEPASIKIRAPEMPRWEEPLAPRTSDSAASSAPPRMPGSSANRAEVLGRRPAVRQANGPMPKSMLGEPGYVDPLFDKPAEESASPRPEAPARSETRHPLRGSRPAGDRRSLLDSGLKDFRDVISEAQDLGEATARSAKSARDNYAAPPLARDLDHRAELAEANDPHDTVADVPPPRLLEPAMADDMRPVPAWARTPPTEADLKPARRPLREFVKLGASILVLACLGIVLAWQWPNMVYFYRAMRTQTQTETAAIPDQPSTGIKNNDRYEAGGQSTQQNQQSATGPSATAPAAVAQRVVLYEEDPSDPAGKRSVGSAIWHTETVSPGPGLPPELAVRADVEIPERQITMTWSLRRNTDPNLPASHTVEIMFKLPPDFSGGGVSNVPGILMKAAEQVQGAALRGLAVKVTNGYFLVGLSAVDADQKFNMALLKDRAWFDIPLVYNNNRRAILAVEKGTPGEKAFAEAFKVWRQ